jgi:phosphatidylserine decarboxylase
MSIAREGYPFILGSLVPGLILVGLYPVHELKLAFIVGLVLIIFGLACMGFFRNPRRAVPTDEKFLVSPADGKVLQVVEVDDDYVGKGYRIDIFLSVFDVHVNRTPSSGTVEFVKYRAGKFFSAFKDKASEDNERNDVGIAGRFGRLRVAQIAGSIARRIVCQIRETDQVSTGQVFGMIRFGSRTELTFSKNYRPRVSPGQRVKGGETIMAEVVTDA